jgi:hypothetical protein
MAVTRKTAKPVVRDLLILRVPDRGGSIRIKAASVKLEGDGTGQPLWISALNQDDEIVARFMLHSILGYVWPDAIPPEDAKRPES